MSDERQEKAYTTVEWSPGPAPPIISTANGHVKRESANIIPDAVVRTPFLRCFGLLDSVRRVLDLRPSETDNQQQVHNALNVLEDQLEDQWKPRQDERPPSPGHLYVGSFSKATPSKCLRLYCSSSSTTQPQNQTTQSSIVLSRITTSSVCPPLTVAGLPVATQAVRTPHRLFNHYTTGNTSAGKRGRAGSVALHASSRVTVLNTTTESGLGTPLQVLHLTQEREQESGDMESQRLGKERIVLVQQGVLLDTPEIQTH
ncbi:glucocorticoid modulatory element-binding protein 1-like isoform X2 [Oncorhynchus keta]|nr:glucocorticoid modulatory element-binding protein 1-like isoform X2 [Oncorhynchus keta]XP_052345234.1 glucocorticoid modulatory element-binding protein 1-like isoform X2 [Oncorhynchus keta]XP_052345235.1 glucocorticoid modulatory element-binding protein 1-like isoform X2 [Oncorhynchus keta]